MDLLQTVTGARLTYCYFRFGGVARDVDDRFVTDTRRFVADFRKRLPMYRDLVTDNVILRGRCEDIGALTRRDRAELRRHRPGAARLRGRLRRPPRRALLGL